MKLLVVCLGNICRSPMGEGVLRARIERSPLAGRVQVDSAGIAGWHRGKAPDPRAVACARRHGVDISGLRARQLEPADFHRFDHILCADPGNLDDVLALAPPEARGKAALLLPWAGIATASVVPDPYYGDDTDFEHCWTLLEAAAEAAVRRLSARPDSGIIGP